jgi:hypothetical protein
MLPASLGESQLDPTLLALHCIENRGKLGTGEWLALIVDSWHELVEGSQSGTFEKKLLCTAVPDFVFNAAKAGLPDFFWVQHTTKIGKNLPNDDKLHDGHKLLQVAFEILKMNTKYANIF